jgi:hypothetical protein
MSAGLMDKLLDVVVAAEGAHDDFVGVGMAVLALAISKLPPAEREETLQAIEIGALRHAVEMFPSGHPLPFPKPNGHATH